MREIIQNMGIVPPYLLLLLCYYLFVVSRAEENVNHLWKRIISSEQKQITIETAMKMESNPNATENIIGL